MNQRFVNSHVGSQENWVCKTYNIDLQRFKLDGGEHQVDSNVIPQSDSEDGPRCEVIFSESEGLVSEAEGHVDDLEPEVLVESDTSPCNEPSSSSRITRSYGNRNHAQLTFLGKTVCASAHQRLMGIGTSMLSKLRKGENAFTNKSRVPLPKHPGIGISMRTSSRDKWPRVLSFLWPVYHSAAEVLPTKFRMPNGYLKEGVELNDEDDFLTRYVSTFLHGLHSYHNMPDLHKIGPGSFEGPRRFLQHRKPIDVYNEYIAFETAGGRMPANFSTFMKVFHAVAKDHLKFRSKGEHAECNTCSKMKKQMSKANNQEDREKAYRVYSSHILAQWVDRQAYWSNRTLSQSWFRAFALFSIE